MPTSRKAKCHFLDLPPELRNPIYDYVLAAQGDSVIIRLSDGTVERLVKDLRRRRSAPFKNESTRKPSLCLFKTCKQVRREAIAMIYSEALLLVEPFPKMLSGRNMLSEQAEAYTKALLGLPASTVPTEYLHMIRALEFADLPEFEHILSLKHDDVLRDVYHRPIWNMAVSSVFSGITHIKITSTYYTQDMYHYLNQGTSWLSWSLVLPSPVLRLLQLFPGLRTIEMVGPGGTQSCVIQGDERSMRSPEGRFSEHRTGADEWLDG